MSSSFIDALLHASTPVIMEIKKQNAHGENLLGSRSLSEIVDDYHAVGAPCLSVVTGRWFGGSDELLRDIACLTTLPILKKDFVTKESQIIQAKALGASAVLLTAQILPRSLFQRLIETSLRHALTPFVEVISEEEIDAVVHGEDCVVAINNKDIRQGERGRGDVNRSLCLLPSTHRTETRCPVSASGIDNPEIAAQLVTAGFEGLLIGTSLLRTQSLETWFRKFEQHRHTPGGAQ
ncbi:MAG: indole-3-glycerol-phosphate synthase [Egibacteraceae bacterium]